MNNEVVLDRLNALGRICCTAPSQSGERAWLQARVTQLIELYASEGVEIAMVTLLAPHSLLVKFGITDGSKELGVPIWIDPTDSLAVDCFLLSIQVKLPGLSMIRPVLGLAFPGLIGKSQLETRWVLQEIDGMDADVADRAARHL